MSQFASIDIDVSSGALVGVSEPARQVLPGMAALRTADAPWWRALSVDDSTRRVLNLALREQQPFSLPPFAIRPGEVEEYAVGACMIPSLHGGAVSLILAPAFTDALAGLPVRPAVGDMLAVLGIDRLRGAAAQSDEASATLVSSLHRQLLSIMRPADSLSNGQGASLILCLHEVTPGEARDLCRALLSHLHRAMRQTDGNAPSARLRMGLASVRSKETLLSTLLAADRAMLQSRTSWASQQVREEDEQDFAYLVTDAIQRSRACHTPHAPHDLETDTARRVEKAPLIKPMERDIEGYVTDNMEGAVDQAVFLGPLDIPVAIVGAVGTGKGYIAKVLHEASGGSPDNLLFIDCRELRGRKQAESRLEKELSRSEGKTLVFKSPHLMHEDTQSKLARQVSTRLLSGSPPRALTGVRFVALFPQPLDTLVRRQELTVALASAFGGYPIPVPPIRDRKQAVLRWAHKILEQESLSRDRAMQGFTPDAEQAMLAYDWPGNISEMRECIRAALDRTRKSWLTPVDLGLYEGIDPEGMAYVPESKPFLVAVESASTTDQTFATSALDSLDVALGQAVDAMLGTEVIKPLGTWLDDELVLAVLERYGGEAPRAADYLHTRSRNISRWLPKIQSREETRTQSALWQSPRKLLREWVRESPRQEESPMLTLQNKLIVHVEQRAGAISSTKRAQILGVSTPTYLKRVKALGL